MLSVASICSWISAKRRRDLKCSNRCRDSAFVRLSTGISAVRRYLISKRPFLNSYRNHMFCISTCFKRITIHWFLWTTSRIVCWLSHQILKSKPNSNPISSMSLTNDKLFLVVRSTPKSSASMVDVVTMSCLLAFQATGLPNRDITYPYKECRIFRSFIKEVSFAIIKTSASINAPLYSIVRKRVTYK